MCLTAVFLFHCAVEDRNFALFNFVNEQNNEAEALRDQISQVSIFSLFYYTLLYEFLPFLTLFMLLVGAEIEYT